MTDTDTPEERAAVDGFGGFELTSTPRPEPVRAPRDRVSQCAGKMTGRTTGTSKAAHGTTERDESATVEHGKGKGGWAPPPVVSPGAPAAFHELLSMRVDYVAKLAPTTLEVNAYGQRCVLTTSRRAYSVAIANNTPTLLGGEYTLAAFAVANERMWPSDFGRCIARKIERPKWRLLYSDAVGVIHGAVECEITFAEMFYVLELKLTGYEIG